MDSRSDIESLLFEGNLSGVAFLRRGLAMLESLSREVALLLLADELSQDKNRRELKRLASGMRRPSWGLWLALIRQLKSKASGPSGELMAEMSPSEVDAFQPLFSFAPGRRRSPKRIDAVMAAVALRNRLAHKQLDVSEVDRAEIGTRALLSALIPLEAALEDRFAGDGTDENAFFRRLEGRLHSFAGFDDRHAVRLISRTGQITTAEDSHDVLVLFERMLGRQEGRLRDFTALESELGSEALSGYFVGGFLVGPPKARGLSGMVHVGWQLATGRRVAMKFLSDTSTDIARRRFLKEAEALSRFKHEHIVGVVGSGEATWERFGEGEGEWMTEFERGALVRTFLALEWIEGRPLDEVVKAEAVGVDRAIAWFADLADVLEVVHASGVVHRDIKPSNIMITADDRAVLMDFGVARTLDEYKTVLTVKGTRPESVAYMAPEQIRSRDGESEVGPAADVYGLCATIHESLSRSPIFSHDTLTEEVICDRKLRGARPPSLRGLGSSIPWSLDVLISGGLDPDIESRPAGAAALAADLRRVLANEPIRFRRSGLARRLRLGYRRNQKLCNLGLVLIAAILAGYVAYVSTLERQKSATRAETLRAKDNKSTASANEKEANTSRDAARADEKRAADSESEAKVGRREADEQAANAQRSTARAFEEAGAVHLRESRPVEALMELQKATEVSMESPTLPMRLAEAHRLLPGFVRRLSGNPEWISRVDSYPTADRIVTWDSEGVVIGRRSDFELLRRWRIPNPDLILVFKEQPRALIKSWGGHAGVVDFEELGRISLLEDSMRFAPRRTPSREAATAGAHWAVDPAAQRAVAVLQTDSGPVEISIWDTETGRRVRSGRGPDVAIRNVGFAADGRIWIAHRSAVEVFDIELVPRGRWEDPPEEVFGHHRNSRLVGVDSTKGLVEWDAATGAVITTISPQELELENGDHPENQVWVGPAGRWVFGKKKGVLLSEGDEDGHREVAVTPEDWNLSLIMSPDGRFLLRRGTSGIVIHSLPDGEVSGEIRRSFKFSNLQVESGGEFAFGDQCIWRPAPGRGTTPRTMEDRYRGWVIDSWGGFHAKVWDTKQSLRRHDATDSAGDRRIDFEGFSEFGFDRSGAIWLTVGSDRTMWIDALTYEVIAERRATDDEASSWQRADCTRNGEWLLVQSSDSQILVLSVREVADRKKLAAGMWKEFRQFSDWHAGTARCVAVATASSKNGRIGGGLRVVGLNDGKTVMTVADPEVDFELVRISDDESRVVVRTSTREFRVYEVATGRWLATLDARPAKKTEQLDFSDGRIVYERTARGGIAAHDVEVGRSRLFSTAATSPFFLLNEGAAIAFIEKADDDKRRLVVAETASGVRLVELVVDQEQKIAAAADGKAILVAGPRGVRRVEPVIDLDPAILQRAIDMVRAANYRDLVVPVGNDILEPNDDPETDVFLQPGRYADLQVDEDDIDHHRINIPAWHRLSWRVEEEGRVLPYLQDAKGRPFWSNGMVGGNEGIATSVEREVRLVFKTGHSMVPQKYSLEFRIEPVPTSERHLVDDIPEDARPLRNGADITTQQRDHDFYRLFVPEGHVAILAVVRLNGRSGGLIADFQVDGRELPIPSIRDNRNGVETFIVAPEEGAREILFRIHSSIYAPKYRLSFSTMKEVDKDRFEPNDGPAFAGSLPPGRHEDLELYGVDWFRICNEENSRSTRITIRSDDAEMPVDADVVDLSGWRLQAAFGSPLVRHIEVRGDALRPRFLRVFGVAKRYSVEIEECDAPEDPEEREELLIGRNKGGEVWNHREFLLIAPAAGRLSVRALLERFGRADYEVCLLDEGGTRLDESGFFFSREAELTVDAEKDARYRVEIRRKGGHVSPISIDVALEEPHRADAFEPNDSPAEAKLLGLGQHEGLVLQNWSDWYRLPHRAEGRLRVEVKASRRGMPLAAGLTAGPFGFSGERAMSLVLESALGQETNLEVRGPNGAPYVIVVSASPEATDLFEPNDEKGEAAPIVPGRYENLALAGPDWYRFEAKAGQEYRFLVEGVADSRPFAMSIEQENPPLGLWARSEFFWAGDPRRGGVYCRSPETRSLFVCISGPPSIYALVLDEFSYQAADALEPNDDNRNPAEISPGHHSSLVSRYADYYEVDVPAGNELVVRLNESEGGARLNLDLLAARSVPGTHDESDRPKKEVRNRFWEAENAALIVHGDQGVVYDLEIELVPITPADCFEPNETESTAAKISTGHYDDLVLVGEDHYLIDVEAGCLLDVFVESDDTVAWLWLTLRGPNGELAFARVSEGRGRLAHHVPRAGAWQLSLSGDRAPYSLTLAISKWQAADRFEPNDVDSDRKLIEPGVHEGLVLQGRDLYEVVVPAGTQLVARVVSADPDAIFDAFLGEPRLREERDQRGTAVLKYVARERHRVGIDVQGEPMKYSLEIALERSGFDALEPNDLDRWASPVGECRLDGLICDGSDWYTIALEAGQTVVVDIEREGAGGEVNFFVAPSRKTAWRYSQPLHLPRLCEQLVAGRTRFRWTARSSDRHEIHVRGFEGKYAMNIAIEDG